MFPNFGVSVIFFWVKSKVDGQRRKGKVHGRYVEPYLEDYGQSIEAGLQPLEPSAITRRAENLGAIRVRVQILTVGLIRTI